MAEKREYIVCGASYSFHVFVDAADNVWFKSDEIAALLEYANPQRAAYIKVDEVERRNWAELCNDFSCCSPSTLFVTESGMHQLLLRSSKVESLQFTRWIARKMLPSVKEKLSRWSDDSVLHYPMRANRGRLDVKVVGPNHWYVDRLFKSFFTVLRNIEAENREAMEDLHRVNNVADFLIAQPLSSENVRYVLFFLYAATRVRARIVCNRTAAEVAELDRKIEYYHNKRGRRPRRGEDWMCTAEEVLRLSYPASLSLLTKIRSLYPYVFYGVKFTDRSLNEIDFLTESGLRAKYRRDAKTVLRFEDEEDCVRKCFIPLSEVRERISFLIRHAIDSHVADQARLRAQTTFDSFLGDLARLARCGAQTSTDVPRDADGEPRQHAPANSSLFSRCTLC